MTAEEVEGLIELELAMHAMVLSHNGVDPEEIRHYCIPPKQKTVTKGHINATEEMWVVLDENPQSNEKGALIFYDDVEGIFGVGTKPAGSMPARFIQPCGSFMDALLAI